MFTAYYCCHTACSDGTLKLLYLPMVSPKPPNKTRYKGFSFLMERPYDDDVK